MSIIGKITGLFTTDTTQWTKGIKDASKDVDGLESRFTKFMDKLKGDFGKRSGLGELTELAIGRGAVKGLAEAAKAADEFSKKLLDIQAAAAKGDSSFDDYAVGIAKAMPIIGSITDATENILKLATGQAQEEAEINAILDYRMESTTKLEKIKKDAAEAQLKFVEQLRKAEEAYQLDKTPEGPQKDALKAQFDAAEKIRNLDAGFSKESVLSEMNDTKKKLDDINKEIAARKKLREASEHDGSIPYSIRSQFGKRLASGAVVNPESNEDDALVDKASELSKQLATLKNDYAKQWGTYQQTRSLYAADGAAKIQDINDKAATTAAAAQSEAFNKSLDAQQKQEDERAKVILDAQEKMAEEGKKLMEESDPSLAMADKIKHLKELLDAGDIDKKTFDDQSNKAKEALGTMDDAAGGKDQGYKSAVTEIRRHADIVTAAPAIASPLNDLNKKAQEALAEHKETNRQLKSLVNAAGNRVTVTI